MNSAPTTLVPISAPSRRIDAHHHLWHFSPAEFDWIDNRSSALRRDFHLPELERELHAAGVNGSIAVQARQTRGETDFLLAAAESPGSPILGVVGWLPLVSPSISRLLEPFQQRPRLRGLRHVVQAEPVGFLADPAFNHGIAALADTGLVFDLLLHAGQLQQAVAFVDRHPRQPFVLDHLGKPPIAAGELEPWRTHVTELARRPHVSCKLSGMVNEARWPGWQPADLRPFFDVALTAFTPDRLMIGSDWPVLTVACGYTQWWQTVESWLISLSASEQAAILGDTASRIYRLSSRDTKLPHLPTHNS